MWIVQFARETFDHPQPVQSLAVGTTITWPAAFIVETGGRKTAMVGTGDVANVRDVGAFDDVVGYVKDIGPALLGLLESRDPRKIGLSYSVDDDAADNIS